MVNGCGHHRRDDDDQVLEITNEIEDSGNSYTKVNNESDSQAVAVADAYAKAIAAVFQRVKFTD